MIRHGHIAVVCQSVSLSVCLDHLAIHCMCMLGIGVDMTDGVGGWVGTMYLGTDEQRVPPR